MSDERATRPLSAIERGLLERLCADDWFGVEQARAQAAVARYAGPSHEGTDNCFDLWVPADVVAIPVSVHGPVYGLVVFEGLQPVGFVDLWVTDGRLATVEHSWFTDDPGPLPTADQLRPDSDLPSQ